MSRISGSQTLPPADIVTPLGFASESSGLNAVFSLPEQFKHSSAVSVGDCALVVKAEAKSLRGESSINGAAIPAPIRTRESQGRAGGVGLSPAELHQLGKLVLDPHSGHSSSSAVINLAVLLIYVGAPSHGVPS